jgi:hypothetical protein
LPSRAIRPQIQIGKPTLPEHGAIASQAGDGDGERLLQPSKTGEGRAPVRSAELEPGDGGTAAVPADDLPGEGVGLGRPGDSQLITSRPNNAEGIPTPSGGAGSAGMPVTAGCWLSAHADASDPSDDPSPREPVRGLEQCSAAFATEEMHAAPSQAAFYNRTAMKWPHSLLNKRNECAWGFESSEMPAPQSALRRCTSLARHGRWVHGQVLGEGSPTSSRHGSPGERDEAADDRTVGDVG